MQRFRTFRCRPSRRPKAAFGSGSEFCKETIPPGTTKPDYAPIFGLLQIFVLKSFQSQLLQNTHGILIETFTGDEKKMLPDVTEWFCVT